MNPKDMAKEDSAQVASKMSSKEVEEDSMNVSVVP